jgi:hypothetical protein
MRRRRARQLEEAAEIRSIQCGQAELAAVAAEALVHGRTAARARCDERLLEYETGWRAALAEAPASDISRTWSAAVVHQVSVLAVADEDLSQAHSGRAMRHADWAEAISRHRLVAERARDAGRALAKHIEEAQLREISERFSTQRQVR